ncbi:MAG TPA: DNA recombination protein RmuC [Candidatus Pristimantibacillus sp.]|jgi:DNA recombination protein RmuC|nr:DNA recombination protein RmuC [Candidatus Pristimantibacillus sp.]
MLAAVIILGVLCVALAAMMLRKPPAPAETNVTLLLKQDLGRLSDDITKLKDGLQHQISDRMDKNQEMMRDSIQKQFAASSKIITDVTERLAKLDETNKRVVTVADELKTLQNVLQNPKQRGVLGEYYLSQVLENVLPPERYKLQHKFRDGEIVDAVVTLDKGRMLSVDSKFSLENYNRLVEEKDKVQRDVLAKAFKADLKNRIDETAKYIRPQEGTMDYAFMFIPSEAIYYDLLINKVGATNTSARDLIEYAFRDKKVIIVSPTTFMAYLQTVLQGLRSLQIEEQAKEIQLRVGELGRHIATYEQLMQKLGGSLGTTVNHFNNAHKELKKVDKDVVKIADTAPSVEPMLLDQPVRETD